LDCCAFIDSRTRSRQIDRFSETDYLKAAFAFNASMDTHWPIA